MCDFPLIDAIQNGDVDTVAIVYDVGVTLDLPRSVTVGTALNALAHCAEALYGRRSERSDECALRALASGAASIARVCGP